MNTPPNCQVAIFTTARQLSGQARAAYLDQACEGNVVLRQRVERLLRANEEAGKFLQEPALAAQRPAEAMPFPGAAHVAGVAPAGEKVGDRIGGYRLLEQIGQGGCGVVYMAEQEEPVRRKVALKVIKLGMDTRQVVARFEAERQALALMDHPNIAKVFDAGATAAGRPYFVMELVRGIKITQFCDENQFETEARLKLFTQVCQAIQHAHQKGIIHRDIKPSNILVEDHDGTPVPKVIDFGVAKATADQRLTDKTLFTSLEQFIGTPAYMSPEQAKLSGRDIDTRTDIYSLGVLLYELLTGTTPFDTQQLLAAGLDEMCRAIRDVEPLKPSTRVTKERAAAAASRQSAARRADEDGGALTKRRYSNLPKLIHVLRGDLDCIVMKAIEKDRERRYATANGLGRDVQRFLTGEPVVARAPSKLYRLQKLVRRNKLAFAAGTAVFLALVAGLGISNWFFLRERSAEQKQTLLLHQVQASEKQACDINRFLKDYILFKVTPEGNARAKKVTMDDVLEQATGLLDIDDSIANQPALEATLRLDFGIAYRLMGALSEAERNLRCAYDLRRATLGPTNLDTLAAGYELARFLYMDARKPDETEALFKEAWQGRRQLLGEEHPDTVDALEGYEVALLETGRLAEAERFGRQILPIRERDRGLNSGAAIHALLNLADPPSRRGDHAEAERPLREALSRCQRERALYSRPCFYVVKELAVQRLLQSDPEDAEKLLNDGIDRANVQFGADHPLTLWMQRLRTRALAEQGRLTEAESLAHTTLTAMLGKTSELPGTGGAQFLLGRILAQQGKLDEAEPHLQKALALIRDNAMGAQGLAVRASNWLGTIEVARKAYPEAERLLLPGADLLFTPAVQMSDNERRLALGNLIALYRAWGKPEQEALWQKKLDSIPDTASARSLRVSRTAESKPADIENKYHEVIAAQRNVLGSDNSTLIATVCDLGAFLKSRDRPEEAPQVYREFLGLGTKPRSDDLAKLPPIVAKLAEELNRRGQSGEADKLYEEAIEVARRDLGESHPALLTLLDRFTDLLVSEGRFDVAAEQFLQVAQIRRAKPGYGFFETLYYLSWIQLRAGKPQDAEAALREGLDVFRSGRWKENINGEICLVVRLADALLQQNKLPEAEQYCRQAVAACSKYQGDNREHFFHQSVFWLLRVLKHENKLAEAQVVLDKMLARERRITVAAGLLAEAAYDNYKNREDDPETRDFFLHRGMEVLRDVPPEDVFKAMPVLSGLINHGYMQAATNICWRILDSSTTDAGWFNRAAWYFATTEIVTNRDPVLAVELAKRSVSLNGDLNTLGVARYRAGDFKQALADLEKSESISIPPNVGGSFNWFFMAMAHHRLGNDDAAQRCYDQALRWMKDNRPQDAELIRFRAEAEELLGRGTSRVENQSTAPSIAR